MSEALSSKRKKIVEEIKSKISEKPVLCIGGNVKSGKTLLLKELAKELQGTEYYDAKTLSEDDFELWFAISDSIESSDGKIYLIDNFSYLFYCDRFFNDIGYKPDENETTSARIIAVGNQNILKSLVARFYFFDDLDEVYFDEDYLNFAEWEELHGGCSEVELSKTV